MQVIVCLFTLGQVHGLHGGFDVEVGGLVLGRRWLFLLLLLLIVGDQVLLLDQQVIVGLSRSGAVSQMIKLFTWGRLLIIIFCAAGHLKIIRIKHN